MVLRLRWTGDVARTRVRGVPAADQFCSGRGRDSGLDRSPVEALRAEGVRLRVPPSAAKAPVHVHGQVGDAWRTAGVRHAEWMVTPSWAVRTG